VQGDIYRRKNKDKVVLNTKCPHPVYSLKLKEILHAEYSRQKLKNESNFHKIVNKVEQIKIDDENNGNVGDGDDNTVQSNNTTSAKYDDSDYEENGNSEGLTQGDKLNQIKALKQNQNSSPPRPVEPKQRFHSEKSSRRREDLMISDSDSGGLLLKGSSKVTGSNISSAKPKRTLGLGSLHQRSESPRNVYSSNRNHSRNFAETQLEENGNFTPDEPLDRVKHKSRSQVKNYVEKSPRKQSVEDESTPARSASTAPSFTRKSSAVR